MEVIHGMRICIAERWSGHVVKGVGWREELLDTLLFVTENRANHHISLLRE